MCSEAIICFDTYKEIRERFYRFFTVYYDRNFRLKITNNIRRCVWDRAWRQSLSNFYDNPRQLLTCFRFSISNFAYSYGLSQAVCAL